MLIIVDKWITVGQHMKRYSKSLIIREMQIKTTVRYIFTPVRMTIIKKSKIVNAREGVGERGPSYIVGRNVNQCSHYGKQYGSSINN